MSPFVNFSDLLVVATIFLISSAIFTAAVPVAAEAEAPADAAAAEAISPKSDLIPIPGDGGGVLKRDGAVEKESGARKRDGVVAQDESGVEQRVGAVESASKTLVDASGSGASKTPSTSMTTPIEATAMYSNGTIPEGLGADMLQNRGTILRMTYVLCGFSLLILIYFLVKAVQLRRAK